MSKQAQLEVEVGPKYIAEFVYGQEANPNLLEAAVRWVIIITLVFDPIAVLLLIAAQHVLLDVLVEGLKNNTQIMNK